MKPEETLKRLRKHPGNVRFVELQRLVEAFGFRLRRVQGSHHLYCKDGILETINLQPDGSDAKPYQIKQFLKIIERHGLRLEKENE